MEYLESHRHMWDSFNYTVVVIVPLTSTADLVSLASALLRHTEQTTILVCSASLKVPVISGFTMLYFAK